MEQASGPAGELHARPWPDPVVPTVWILHVDRPAVVTGSAQRSDVVEAAAATRYGVEVVRRRSGGGAVLLAPGASTWVDVLIPGDDRLWDDDVGRAFHWLGRAWARALVTPTGVRPVVHAGALVRTEWSDLVCFAGLGAGEVTVGGRKLVGLSQRRTRRGARFQCIVHHRWDVGALLGLLALDDDARRRGRDDLEDAVATWHGDPHRLVASFLEALREA